jgi:alpha-galactosidase
MASFANFAQTLNSTDQKSKKMKRYSLPLIFTVFLLAGCGTDRQDANREPVILGDTVFFSNEVLQLRVDPYGRCRIAFQGDDKTISFNQVQESTLPVHHLITDEGILAGFRTNPSGIRITARNSDEFGHGNRIEITGTDPQSHIERKLFLDLYDRHPSAVLCHATYTNRSGQPVAVREAVSGYFLVDASLINAGAPSDLWTFQGVAYAWGTDYIFRLDSGFYRKNYFGFQPESRLGGGVPMVDIWSQSMGVAIASIETKPPMVSFPTRVTDAGKAEMSIVERVNAQLSPGESFTTTRSAILVHNLDFFDAVAAFASIMKDQGLYMKESSPETYEPFWCSWGYESNFTQEDIYGVLPKLKELNIKWVVVDDRWFDRYGDWNPRTETFPGGEAQMREFVDSLHTMGFLTKIWWVPTLIQPEGPPPHGRWPSATPGSSKLFSTRPEWVVVNAGGGYPRCPRNMYFLDGSLPQVRSYIEQLTEKFIDDWGFDGHKLDAYWVVPPTYRDPAQDSARSYQAVPELIQTIYETSKALKRYSVTEICNCGVPQDFYQSRFTDQPVVADPTSFAQVRRRVKLNKALWGPRCPVFTDHVEHIQVSRNELGSDFASTIGTGGVPGTKFTWPAGPEKVRLTPDKEVHWKKWLTLYRNTMLSQGDYTNLYDLAFDKPETHVIRKGSKQYYAFYGDKWDGEIELRGLAKGKYLVRDYVNADTLGVVSAPNARINVTFNEHLLIECSPVE